MAETRQAGIILHTRKYCEYLQSCTCEYNGKRWREARKSAEAILGHSRACKLRELDSLDSIQFYSVRFCSRRLDLFRTCLRSRARSIVLVLCVRLRQAHLASQWTAPIGHAEWPKQTHGMEERNEFRGRLTGCALRDTGRPRCFSSVLFLRKRLRLDDEYDDASCVELDARK